MGRPPKRLGLHSLVGLGGHTGCRRVVRNSFDIQDTRGGAAASGSRFLAHQDLPRIGPAGIVDVSQLGPEIHIVGFRELTRIPL